MGDLFWIEDHDTLLWAPAVLLKADVPGENEDGESVLQMHVQCLADDDLFAIDQPALPLDKSALQKVSDLALLHGEDASFNGAVLHTLRERYIDGEFTTACGRNCRIFLWSPEQPSSSACQAEFLEFCSKASKEGSELKLVVGPECSKSAFNWLQVGERGEDDRTGGQLQSACQKLMSMLARNRTSFTLDCYVEDGQSQVVSIKAALDQVSNPQELLQIIEKAFLPQADAHSDLINFLLSLEVVEQQKRPGLLPICKVVEGCQLPNRDLKFQALVGCSFSELVARAPINIGKPQKAATVKFNLKGLAHSLGLLLLQKAIDSVVSPGIGQQQLPKPSKIEVISFADAEQIKNVYDLRRWQHFSRMIESTPSEENDWSSLLAVLESKEAIANYKAFQSALEPLALPPELKLSELYSQAKFASISNDLGVMGRVGSSVLHQAQPTADGFLAVMADPLRLGASAELEEAKLSNGIWRIVQAMGFGVKAKISEDSNVEVMVIETEDKLGDGFIDSAEVFREEVLTLSTLQPSISNKPASTFSQVASEAQTEILVVASTAAQTQDGRLYPAQMISQGSQSDPLSKPVSQEETQTAMVQVENGSAQTEKAALASAGAQTEDQEKSQIGAQTSFPALEGASAQTMPLETVCRGSQTEMVTDQEDREAKPGMNSELDKSLASSVPAACSHEGRSGSIQTISFVATLAEAATLTESALTLAAETQTPLPRFASAEIQTTIVQIKDSSSQTRPLPLLEAREAQTTLPSLSTANAVSFEILSDEARTRVVAPEALKELEALSEENSRLEDQLAKLKQELSNHENEAIAMQMEFSLVKKTCSALEEESATAHLRIKQLEDELATLSSTKDNLHEAMEVLQASLKGARARLDELEPKYAKVKKVVRSVVQESDLLNQTLALLTAIKKSHEKRWKMSAEVKSQPRKEASSKLQSALDLSKNDPELRKLKDELMGDLDPSSDNDSWVSDSEEESNLYALKQSEKEEQLAVVSSCTRNLAEMELKLKAVMSKIREIGDPTASYSEQDPRGGGSGAEHENSPSKLEGFNPPEMGRSPSNDLPELGLKNTDEEPYQDPEEAQARFTLAEVTLANEELNSELKKLDENLKRLGQEEQRPQDYFGGFTIDQLSSRHNSPLKPEKPQSPRQSQRRSINMFSRGSSKQRDWKQQ